jgi:hypothetical protein
MAVIGPFTAQAAGEVMLHFAELHLQAAAMNAELAYNLQVAHLCTGARQ